MSLVRPIAGPLALPLRRALTEVRGGKVLSAFSAAKTAVEQGATDVHLLAIGDSTGNGSDEWVYRFGQWLATEYPTHSVSYRLWNDATDMYDAATAISTGSGARTIRIWNASVAGSTAYHLIGSKRAAAIDAMTPHVVVFNHGHNHQRAAATAAGDLACIRGELLMGFETVRLVHPGVPIAAFLENPRRDDDFMAPVIEEVRGICSDYADVAVLDAYGPFIASGKDPALYHDNQHPNVTGSQIHVDAITGKWRNSRAASGFAVAPPFVSSNATNLLTNGDFVAFASALPDGWSTLGSPTVTKDATVVDAGSAYSVKITGTTASSRLFQSLTGILPSLRGKHVTLAVRQFVPDGSAPSVGRIQISYTDGVANSVSSRVLAAGNGGWRWIFISGLFIPDATSSASVSLYCDTVANTDSAAYYDRAVLVASDLPRDML